MIYIGLDIGGTKCAAVVGKQIGESIQILEKLKFDTATNTPQQVIKKFDGFIESMIDKYDIKSIGISCGGPLDSKRGIIISPPNLPDWDNIEIVDHFNQKWKINTMLQNDANACALAEWKFGAGRGYQNVVFLTFGTGLGAGLILNGRLYSGTNDMAGEVGHIALSEDGPVGYGKKGSFEGFCSGGGIAQLGVLAVKRVVENGITPALLKQANGEYSKITAKLIGDMAEAGDAFCTEIYHECGRRLGQGLSIIIDILNPEVIIMGSIYTRSEELLKAEATNVILKESLSRSNSVCKLLKSELGDNLGDIAALSVASNAFSED